jgi:Phytanoyl-CoA dioxygenase (PhyH)
MIWARGKLRRSVERLNRATGKNVNLAAVEELIDSHARPARLARVLRRVLELEADPAGYDAAHPRKEQQEYNHLCDYAAAGLVSRALSLFFDRYDLTALPGYDAGFVERATTALAEEGYVFLETFLTKAHCDRIVDFLSRDDVLFREDLSGREHRGYTPAHVAATRANVCRITDQSKLLASPDIAQLVFDPGLLAVAQDFLGAPPIHTQANCWWSVAYSNHTDYVKAAAQKFHQDRDYIKFLKFFFYLTDVGEDNGPHEFIAGSNVDYAEHSRNKLRSSKRLDDARLEGGYARERFRRFTGPRGSLIVEDTSGFHKGWPVRSGHRLMLQIEYATSVFGSPEAYLTRQAIGAANPALQRFPRLFSAYKAA